MLEYDTEVMNLVIDRHPKSRELWMEESVSTHKDPEVCAEFMPAFSRYILGLAGADEQEELFAVAETIEHPIIQGDRYMYDYVLICVLEGLTNLLLAAPEEVARRVTERMQPKTVEYCRILDRMWGTSTPGI